jgi:hypothetical protein
MAERGGFEPPVPVKKYGSLANCWFQPLTHLSKMGDKNKKIFNVASEIMKEL